jgi:hypothetical protein
MKKIRKLMDRLVAAGTKSPKDYDPMDGVDHRRATALLQDGVRSWAAGQATRRTFRC